MDPLTFSERVLVSRDGFTEFEEKFSAYLLDRPLEATSRTISSLSSEFHISPNAIVRLSHKLGYEGFSDMRISLRNDARRAQDAGNPKTGSTLDLVSRTESICRHSKAMSHAARLMKKSDRVALFAVGETAFPAHAFASRMGGIDNKTRFMTYENEMRRTIDLPGRTLAIFVSLSGETPQVLNMAHAALERGIETISLTHLHPNSLSVLTKLQLWCFSPHKTYGDVNLTDLTPVMAALTFLEQSYLQSLSSAGEETSQG